MESNIGITKTITSLVAQKATPYFFFTEAIYMSWYYGKVPNFYYEMQVKLPANSKRNTRDQKKKDESYNFHNFQLYLLILFYA